MRDISPFSRKGAIAIHGFRLGGTRRILKRTSRVPVREELSSPANAIFSSHGMGSCSRHYQHKSAVVVSEADFSRAAPHWIDGAWPKRHLGEWSDSARHRRPP